MDRTELAWAAGFFDGEGWAALSTQAGRATGQPMAQINQSGSDGIPAVLERFRGAVQVGRVRGPVLEEGKLPRYWWVASSRADVTSSFEAIRPWLGRIKRQEFAHALQLPVDPLETIETAEGLAWAAGLFDGEGSTYNLKHRTHPGHFVLEAAITQSSREGEPEVLRRFLEIAGVGRIYGPYEAGEGQAPVYRWKAHRAAAIINLIEMLWPWLGDVKRVQAERAISVIRLQPGLLRGNPAWGNRKTHCVKGHAYATGRIRRFRGRGKNTEAPRESHHCLVCLRDYARKKRGQQKSRA